MTTCFLAPDPIQSTFFIPGGNTVANGGQLFFYAAGSSTKQTVYKDNAAATAWTNPIVLDSGGNLPSGGEVWFPTGQTFKVIFAPSTDTDPPASPYWTKDNLSGINDTGTSTTSEWLTGPSPSFVNGTQFTLAGDQTGTFTVGRRLKTTNTAGTVYSRIVTSVFGSSTTVNVSSDSGALDSGLSAVSYGILNPVNPSVPALRTSPIVFADSADPSKTASVDMTAFATSTNAVLKPHFLISRTATAGTSNVNFTPSDFPWTTFKQYIFEIQQVRATANATDPNITLSIDSGSTYLSSSYQYVLQFSSLTTSSAFSSWAIQAGNNANITLADTATGLWNSGVFNYSAKIRLINPASTSEAKVVVIDSITHPQVGTSSVVFGRGFGSLSSQIVAINGIKFALTGGLFSTGVISVYGLQD